MAQLRINTPLPPRSSRARIGLFGGSFDPPHMGHMHVAQTALKRLGLDQIWWFPTPGNPLKNPPGAYRERFASVLNLTRHNRAMRVSDIEQREDITYSIDLIKLAKQRCPRARLVWLIGADSLMTMHYWKDWQDIAETIPIAAIARPGFEQAARRAKFAQIYRQHFVPAQQARSLPNCPCPAWTYLTAPLRMESSTRLRSLSEGG